MRFEDIDPAAIPARWGWLRALLAPAIAYDEAQTEESVREHLERGSMRAMRLVEGGDGVVVVELSGRTLFLNYVAGRLDGGPKERLRKIRAIERAFIEQARAIGCIEIQGGGRNWHRVLDGWEPDGGAGVSLRKAI